MPRSPFLLPSNNKKQNSSQYHAVTQQNNADNDNPVYVEEGISKGRSKEEAHHIQELREYNGARRRVSSRHRSKYRSPKAATSASLNYEYSSEDHERPSSTRTATSSISDTVSSNGVNDGFRLSTDEQPDGFLTGSQSYEGDGSDNEETVDESHEELDPLDNSPYSQVRASVSPTDDVSLSINTPRMWMLSMLFAVLGSSTNLFFSLRYPSVSISPIIALLLVHPLGLLWDRALKRLDDPDETYIHGSLTKRDGFSVGEGFGSTREFADRFPRSAPSTTNPVRRGSSQGVARDARLWFAQGRWNEKEHTCVYISSNVSFGFAFATDVIVEQAKFYNQDVSLVYQILLILSTQTLGYAFAGITRRYLVQPSGMVWPATLVSSSLFSTLHKNKNQIANGWRISPARFFSITVLGSLTFYFLPGLLMPALSYFNIITWFAPNSVVIANLFGVSSGLGMFPMTFDWSQIAYIGSPLVVPFWAALNVFGGLILVMWIIAPLLYYSNFFYSAYMPILSSDVFDNEAKPYNVTRILTPENTLDERLYEDYSRVYMPITYVLSYALQFAGICSLVTHTVCWHGKDIWRSWRKSLQEIEPKGESAYNEIPQFDSQSERVAQGRRMHRRKSMQNGTDDLLASEDVHARLMRRYKSVPIYWYALTGILTSFIGIFIVEYFPIHLPWYGVLLAIAISAVLYIPIGIVMAVTNQQSSTYLICQLLCGLLFPGRPIANMVFVTYGYITSLQGLKFTSDLKLGQYMKIPPRILFNVQISATLISSFTQLGVLNWMLSNIRGICTSEAVNGFTCPLAKVHFNGSILWGTIGPVRFFGYDALYRPLIWAFLIGAVAPVCIWVLGRRGNRSFWSKVNLPVVFGSLSWIPPASGLNFSVWAIICFIFNYHIMRRYNAWWKKYNMTLSAALDSGVALGVVLIFFGVYYPGWLDDFHWWGTEIYKQGCDWKACSYKNLAPGEKFGAKTW